MDIKKVIAVINQMQADGVIERYAIGGAVGATFYLEPVATLDLDIFVTFESDPGSLIVSRQRIYDYLTARGGTIEREYISVLSSNSGKTMKTRLHNSAFILLTSLLP